MPISSVCDIQWQALMILWQIFTIMGHTSDIQTVRGVQFSQPILTETPAADCPGARRTLCWHQQESPAEADAVGWRGEGQAHYRGHTHSEAWRRPHTCRQATGAVPVSVDRTPCCQESAPCGVYLGPTLLYRGGLQYQNLRSKILVLLR